MFGAFGSSYANPQRWSFSTSYRYMNSDRHFVGPEYQADRDEEGSQVINWVRTVEVGLTYNVNARWSVTGNLPYQVADRSQALRYMDEIVDRRVTEGDGIGDMTIVGRRWMLDPATHAKTNFRLGLGVKLPTGNHDQEDEFEQIDQVTGDHFFTRQAVDQSIQPGDGGTGIILDGSYFRSWNEGRVTFYGGATWLFNPKGKNGTPTNRSRAGEEIMGASDQYLGRLGVTFSGPGWKGFAFGLGGRLEGTPVHDVLGSSNGFRRPGYSVAWEPSLSWSRGPSSVNLSVPIMEYRNRTRSIADRNAGGGRHGDAAFADWVVMASYSYRFGKRLDGTSPKDTGTPAIVAEPTGL